MEKKLGFGMMRLPLENTDDEASVDINKTIEMVDAFIIKGFTYFDTAYMYHGDASENVIRQVLTERYPREAYILTTKLPVWYMKKPGDDKKYFNEQIGRLGVEYLDYYLLHGLDAENHALCEKLHTYEFLAKLKADGKIKNTGFSFHGSPELLEAILTKYHDIMDIVQIQLNYLDWNSNTIQSKECYEICRRYNKPVMVMEPVKGGTLADLTESQKKILAKSRLCLSPAGFAIAFAVSLPGVERVLSGMSNLEQVRENIKTIESVHNLSEEDYKLLEEVAELIRKDTVIACTGCHYCIEGCPSNIKISEYFRLYNEHHRDDWQAEASYRFAKFTQTHASPSNCIECGACEKVCPQKLSIIKLLKKVEEGLKPNE